MNILTVLKPVPIIQIGHLYEHLYTQKLVRFLYERGIFEYIDYNLDASTYYSGLVSVELTWYSEEVAKLIPTIKAITIDMDEDSINNAWNEVESEKQHYFGYSAKEDIRAALQQLDQQPWQDLNEIDSLALPIIPEDQNPFYVSTDAFPKTKDLQIQFSIARSEEINPLLPLFDRCIRAASANIQHRLTDSLGIYFCKFISKRSQAKMTYTLIFTTFPEFQVEAEEVTDKIDEALRWMGKKDGFERLLATIDLHDRYVHEVKSDFMSLYKTTDQIVGHKGWQKICTMKNVEKLLRATKTAIH